VAAADLARDASREHREQTIGLGCRRALLDGALPLDRSRTMRPVMATSGKFANGAASTWTFPPVPVRSDIPDAALLASVEEEAAEGAQAG
jgi:hypothetical protein